MPNPSWSESTESDVALSVLLAPCATSSTTALTPARPSTHPIANIGPSERAFGVASIRITAMIGIGLSATPSANGRTLLIASVNMSRT